MSITLINTTKRMKVYNLPHESFCKALGGCKCTILAGRDNKRLCSSISIPAGAFIENMPDAIMEIAEVIRDLKSGNLRAHRVATPAAATITNNRKANNGNKRKKTR